VDRDNRFRCRKRRFVSVIDEDPPEGEWSAVREAETSPLS
jgi:hypothetical protein